MRSRDQAWLYQLPGCGWGRAGGGGHKKTPARALASGVFGCQCLTMTYFHRRTSTIIGAKAFHDSVRDGKAWGHLAMVVKRKPVLEAAACIACTRGATSAIWIKKPNKASAVSCVVSRIA